MQLYNSRHDAGVLLAAKIQVEENWQTVWFAESDKDIAVANGIGHQNVDSSGSLMSENSQQRYGGQFYRIKDCQAVAKQLATKPNSQVRVFIVKDCIETPTLLSKETEQLRRAGFEAISVVTPLVLRSLVPVLSRLVDTVISLQTVPLMIDADFWYLGGKNKAKKKENIGLTDASTITHCSHFNRGQLAGGGSEHLHLVKN